MMDSRVRVIIGASVLALWGHVVGLATSRVYYAIWQPCGAYGFPWVALAVFGALLGAYVGARPRRWGTVALIGACYPPALYIFWLLVALVRARPVFLDSLPQAPVWMLRGVYRETAWEMLLIVPAAQAVSGWIDRRSREVEAEAREAAAGPRRAADGTWEL